MAMQRPFLVSIHRCRVESFQVCFAPGSFNGYVRIFPSCVQSQYTWLSDFFKIEEHAGEFSIADTQDEPPVLLTLAFNMPNCITDELRFQQEFDYPCPMGR